MRNSIYQKILAWAALVLALTLVYAGRRHIHQVFFDRTAQPDTVFVPPSLTWPGGPPPPNIKPLFQEISDSDLVVNATFTGVVRKGDKLYWTYDPSNKQGKQACPT